MILMIRGHIRNSFESKDLYSLVKEFYALYPDLKIFIHTWDIFANNISYRQIAVNNKKVNNQIIYDYFDDLQHLIKNIIIDDDTQITLIGNTSGNIQNITTPLIGWKNYWYGKHRVIEDIHNKNVDKNKAIINLRFDIMDNSNNFEKEKIINFIKDNNKMIFTKNAFIFDNENNYGIDNIYIGNIETMYKLINKFFYELDDILIQNKNIGAQEFLVYRINNTLFE
jgi:hypothetical protein